jgi:hypothetical protein
MDVDPGGDDAFPGHWLSTPETHTCPGRHCTQTVDDFCQKPARQTQSENEEEPTAEVKFAGHETEMLLLPPAQYDPARQIEHGLVPDLEPSP